jgi:GntR family transcriptional regulator
MADPMYRRIAEDLQSQIESGKLKRGSQLPTEIDLREKYEASRNTVRDAIKWLTTRGLVETRPGQGTFVVEKISPFVTTLTGDPGAEETDVYVAEVEAAGRTSTSSKPRVEIQQADAVQADALRIEIDDPIVSRHQERSIDGIPWSLQTTFYPMSLVDRGAKELLSAVDIDGGTVAYLAEQCGIKQASYRDTISMRAPDKNEAEFFKLPPDGRVSVFEVHRVGFDGNGERFRLTVTIYPADRNRLKVNVGEVPARAAEDEGQPPPADDPLNHS